jgi:hypothetical protein
MLRWEGAILAVLIPFAIPSPNIGSPRITPRIGPGNSITAKFILAKATRPDIAKVVPPAASSPATRISFDEGIVALINSIKLGVKVRILVDERLISEYHRVYSSNIQKSESLPFIAKHSEERKKVVENPWYHSGVEIERRGGQIPFGLIIFDRNEVGIELVDSYNPDKFTAGILVKDNQIGDAMLRLYEELWHNSHSV